MAGVFASRWWGSMSIGLVALAGTSLFTQSAQANTTEPASFAQTAVVTHWSLPMARPQVGAMIEPAFASASLSNTASDASADIVSATAASMATPHANPKNRRQARLAGVDGPSLPADDLEARGVATYDSDRPYRTPGDIKALEVAFQLLNAADAVTTVVCLNRDDCHENNPIYGKHPKPIVVVGSKAAVGAIHYLAMRSLLPDHPGLARALGWVSVAIQGTVVGLNLSQLF